jgi:hypothetical protein
MDRISANLSASPLKHGYLKRAALALAFALLIAGCGGSDDPAKPDVTQGYRIRGSLLADMQTATVVVTRLDSSDPSALGAAVLIDGAAVAAHPSSTPDQAAFQQLVVAELARAHTFSVEIGGKTATGTLVTADEASTLTITQPPAGARTFSPDMPLTLEWGYVGSKPEEISIFGTNVGFTHIVVFSDTLAASARSTVVPTAQWSFASQILIRVAAQTKSEVDGDLAAPGSFSQVLLAEVEIILNRR